MLLDPDSPVWAEQAPPVFWADFQTSKGRFVVEVHRDWAPHGADRFYNLVRNGFYDDMRISRVRAGFIAQFGLSGDPAITAAWEGHTIPDDPVRQSNTRGYVAYAMTGPDTRLTQVYINYGDNSRLDVQGFAPFGRVVEGMEVVDRFYSGYGENAGGGMRGGKQGPVKAGGNAYLDKEYPNLDRITSATVVIKDFPTPAIAWQPRHYVALRTDVPIAVDGRLVEASWQEVSWTDEFVDIEGSARPSPRFSTRAKMLWDDSFLYVAAQMEEPDVWATLTQRDAVIYHDNDFEIFIDPDGDTHSYYELEVNARGTEWDLFPVKPYRDGGVSSGSGMFMSNLPWQRSL
ncbi:MAG: peptidylprolyl isomerase [Gemmatimonadales bacterium]